jgi:trk system potassium uptake protein TrkH
MLIGQANFAVHNMFFQKNWKGIFQNAEVRMTVISLMIVIPLIFIFVTVPLYAGNFSGFFNFYDPARWWAKFGIALRYAFFEPVTALTTTGFNTAPTYTTWASFGILILIMLMWIGGHTNSTAGGLKQLRVFMLIKSLYWYLHEQFIPKSAVVRRYIYKENKVFIESKHLVEILSFLIIYLITFITGSLIITAYNYPIDKAFFEFASSLGTVGITIGVTQYNAPAGVLITETLGMFLGRLEFFVIILSLVKFFKDINVIARKRKYDNI